ncbi:mitofilin family membrane protein [Fulvimarina sp. MAC3]|uniref:COG4223 family protein n=1 Tax=Fulvimarina sp. MAC3 TaxID=3148887 RepID=UPI0031FDD142
MTNRPRRSRPNRSRNKTIDGESTKVDTPQSKAEPSAEAVATESAAPEGAGTKSDAAVTPAAAGTGSETVSEESDSIVAKHVEGEPKTVEASADKTTQGTLASPAEQPASAVPPQDKSDKADVDASIGEPVAAEGRGRNSDWSKTGGYQGPAAVTRTPEPVRRTEASARPASERGETPSMAGSGSGTTPPRASSGLGFGGALVAGLVGALVALVVTAYLYSYGYLDEIRAGLAGAPVVSEDLTGQDIERLSTELVTLRREIEASVAANQGASDGIPGLSPAELEQLGNRITALESAAASAASGQQDATGATDDISAFKKALSDTQGSVSDLQASTTGAGQAAAAAQKSADQANAFIGETRQELQAAIEKATKAADARISALEESNSKAQLALAAAGLKSAIDNGNPFATQLQNYSSAGGSANTVAALQPYADKGIPTDGMLAQRWSDVEGKVSAALTGPGTDAPVTDQVMAGLRSLVETRSSGEVPEDVNTPDAIIARLDNDISTGDLKGFVEEWKTLPEDAQKAGSDFFADVQARLAANQVLSDALSSASGSGTNEKTNQG